MGGGRRQGTHTTPNTTTSDQPDRFDGALASARDGSATDRELVIETRALTKRYGEAVVAVDDLALRVRRGEVYGFLGPNGAGKRRRCGCCSAWCDRHRVRQRCSARRPARRRGWRIRSMVEASAFYPFLSGRDNVRALGDPQTHAA